MRILHVTSNADAVTGVNTQVLGLAIAQKERGSSPAVVADRPGYLTEACELHGIGVVVEQGLDAQDGTWWPPAEKTTRSLASISASLGADVIHCHSRIAAAHAFSAGDRYGIPRVFTYHDAPGDLARGVVDMLGSRFAIICVSRIGLEYLKEEGAPAESLWYVPDGTRSMPPGDQVARRFSRPDLMLVGAMEDRKGVDIAICAMRELRRRSDRDCLKLNIYGTGSQEKYFREMAVILGLDDLVKFHGTRAGILECCPSTDILIVPSRTGASPVVVLEAMSRGMPIVASDVGEAAEMLLDPRHGKIIPAESIAALADAVESLRADISAGRFDPELLIARHRSFYTTDKMAERTERIYEKAKLRYCAGPVRLTG